MPTLTEILSAPRDMMSVRRVFGEPIERGDVTLVPVATIRGGGGGGTGENAQGAEEVPAGSGAGGGYGVVARPVGVYVIRGDRVDWKPAIDITRVSIGGMMLAAVFALAVRSVLLRR